MQSSNTRNSFPCPYCTRIARTAHGFRKHLAASLRYGGHELDDNEIALTFLNLESGGTFSSKILPQSITGGKAAISALDDIQEKVATSNALADKTEPELQSNSVNGGSTVEESESNSSIKAKGKTKSKSKKSKDSDSADEFKDFMKELFSSLSLSKDLPKYQFERRIDTILEFFLPEFLSNKYGGEVKFVTPEFPLKRTENNLSNNIDFLFYHILPDKIGKQWIICEVKAINESISHEQLVLYTRAKAKGMKVLLNEIQFIRSISGNKVKYDSLLERIEPFEKDGEVKVVYIIMSRKELEHLRANYPDIEFIGYEELMDYDAEHFPNVWKLFKEFLIEDRS